MTTPSISFTEAELGALYAATDAQIKVVHARIASARSDALRQIFAEALNPLADARKKIEVALRSQS